ncbi:MAG: hypothetical protein Q3962_09055 [Corynebacterium sp.]|nr:hypothetical protein [Corynebacterium sp.]
MNVYAELLQGHLSRTIAVVTEFIRIDQALDATQTEPSAEKKAEAALIFESTCEILDLLNSYGFESEPMPEAPPISLNKDQTPDLELWNDLRSLSHTYLDRLFGAILDWISETRPSLFLIKELEAIISCFPEYEAKYAPRFNRILGLADLSEDERFLSPLTNENFKKYLETSFMRTKYPGELNRIHLGHRGVIDFPNLFICVSNAWARLVIEMSRALHAEIRFPGTQYISKAMMRDFAHLGLELDLCDSYETLYEVFLTGYQLGVDTEDEAWSFSDYVMEQTADFIKLLRKLTELTPYTMEEVYGLVGGYINEFGLDN